MGAALAKIDTALETLRSEFRILAPYETAGPASKVRRIHVREIAELAMELNRALLAGAEASDITCSAVLPARD